MVLSSRLTWVTEAPNRVGTISFMILRTPGSAKPQRGRGSNPSLASDGSCTASCSTPAASTPQASAITGSSMKRARPSAAAIIARFISTGLSAGTANRPQVLRMPPASAASEMNSAYGKVIRSIAAARSPCGVPAPKPGAKAGMIHGAASTASAVSTISAASRVPATRSTRALTAAWSPRALYSARTGTKAIENEPSAESRRRKFGIRKATTKASIAGLAPNTAA